MSIYNTPLEERFGEKLEELREGKNMTRERLAEQVGLTARHIAALERGERRPTLNTMEKLLRTLGAPTEWLIYPEFEEQNARLREISHLAATFSDEQQEFLLGIMRLMRKQKYAGRSIAAHRSAVAISHDADILRWPARLRASGSAEMQ